MNKKYQLSFTDKIWKCTFDAMASPCEILFSADSTKIANSFADFAFSETKRIETKFSRYVTGNITHEINSSDGNKIRLDEETSRLLDFANQCFHLSEGLFDVTSGLLRNCWTFDGSEQTPNSNCLSEVLALVGWDKVKWNNQILQLLSGMELDFGGIGKEYAVDRIAELASSYQVSKVMVNYGGDIRAKIADLESPKWVIGIENPDKEDDAVGTVNMHNGGIATSGDSRRYCFNKGQRLGHILNPKTGWPIVSAPRSVTVIAQSCTEAGMIATMAILQGEKAEEFLELQKVAYKCLRH